MPVCIQGGYREALRQNSSGGSGQGLTHNFHQQCPRRQLGEKPVQQLPAPKSHHPAWDKASPGSPTALCPCAGGALRKESGTQLSSSSGHPGSAFSLSATGTLGNRGRGQRGAWVLRTNRRRTLPSCPARDALRREPSPVLHHLSF